MKYVQAHKQHMSELFLNSFIRARSLMQFFFQKYSQMLIVVHAFVKLFYHN